MGAIIRHIQIIRKQWFCWISFCFLFILASPLSSQDVDKKQTEMTLTAIDSVSQKEYIFEYPDSVLQSNEIIDTLFHVFQPSPTKAVWLAAACPGLGQIYNRKYWKLPIVYGGFVVLTYAVTWNGKYYKDYSNAYRDLMDNNPNTNSYLDFLPPGAKESDYGEEWLKSTFKRKNDYYRRSRDLSMIGMIGLYLFSVLDAYVDAQLYDFDISPDLSLRIEPTIIPQSGLNYNNNLVGVKCCFNF